MADITEFALSPVHGHGVFAKEDIKAGTAIINESATWVVDSKTAVECSFPGPGPSGPDKMRSAILKSWATCNASESDEQERRATKLDILSLTGGLSKEEQVGSSLRDKQMLSERLREILIINGVAVKAGNDDIATCIAVFPNAARINHSCAPNGSRMMATLPDDTVACRITTSRPIKKGEEIFISYLSELLETKERQEELLSRWHFSCACKCCSLPTDELKASDERRKEIINAISMIASNDQHHQEEKPAGVSEIVHQKYLLDLDVRTLGEAGWEQLAVLAAEEEVDELWLFNSINFASEAALRLQRLSLAKELLDRLVVAGRTFKFGNEFLASLAGKLVTVGRLTRRMVELAEAAQKEGE